MSVEDDSVFDIMDAMDRDDESEAQGRELRGLKMSSAVIRGQVERVEEMKEKEGESQYVRKRVMLGALEKIAEHAKSVDAAEMEALKLDDPERAMSLLTAQPPLVAGTAGVGGTGSAQGIPRRRKGSVSGVSGTGAVDDDGGGKGGASGSGEQVPARASRPASAEPVRYGSLRLVPLVALMDVVLRAFRNVRADTMTLLRGVFDRAVAGVSDRSAFTNASAADYTSSGASSAARTGGLGSRPSSRGKPTVVMNYPTFAHICRLVEPKISEGRVMHLFRVGLTASSRSIIATLAMGMGRKTVGLSHSHLDLWKHGLTRDAFTFVASYAGWIVELFVANRLSNRAIRVGLKPPQIWSAISIVYTHVWYMLPDITEFVKQLAQSPAYRDRMCARHAEFLLSQMCKSLTVVVDKARSLHERTRSRDVVVPMPPVIVAERGDVDEKIMWKVVNGYRRLLAMLTVHQEYDMDRLGTIDVESLDVVLRSEGSLLQTRMCPSQLYREANARNLVVLPHLTQEAHVLPCKAGTGAGYASSSQSLFGAEGQSPTADVDTGSLASIGSVRQLFLHTGSGSRLSGGESPTAAAALLGGDSAGHSKVADEVAGAVGVRKATPLVKHSSSETEGALAQLTEGGATGAKKGPEGAGGRGKRKRGGGKDTAASRRASAAGMKRSTRRSPSFSRLGGAHRSVSAKRPKRRGTLLGDVGDAPEGKGRDDKKEKGAVYTHGCVGRKRGMSEAGAAIRRDKDRGAASMRSVSFISNGGTGAKGREVSLKEGAGRDRGDGAIDAMDMFSVAREHGRKRDPRVDGFAESVAIHLMRDGGEDGFNGITDGPRLPDDIVGSADNVAQVGGENSSNQQDLHRDATGNGISDSEDANDNEVRDATLETAPILTAEQVEALKNADVTGTDFDKETLASLMQKRDMPLTPAEVKIVATVVRRGLVGKEGVGTGSDDEEASNLGQSVHGSEDEGRSSDALLSSDASTHVTENTLAAQISEHDTSTGHDRDRALRVGGDDIAVEAVLATMIENFDAEPPVVAPGLKKHKGKAGAGDQSDGDAGRPESSPHDDSGMMLLAASAFHDGQVVGSTKSGASSALASRTHSQKSRRSTLPGLQDLESADSLAQDGSGPSRLDTIADKLSKATMGERRSSMMDDDSGIIGGKSYGGRLVDSEMDGMTQGEVDLMLRKYLLRDEEDSTHVHDEVQPDGDECYAGMHQIKPHSIVGHSFGQGLL